MQRSEAYFYSPTGHKIYLQSWTRSENKTVLFLTHGQGEHSESYLRLAQAVVPYGCDLHCWDLPGHGRSTGKRGYIDHFSSYMIDHQHFIKNVERELRGRPFYLMGHSLGGLITLKSAADKGLQGAQGLLLSAPLLGLSLPVPKIKAHAAGLLNRYMPRLTLHNELNDRMLSQDLDVLTEYKKDPFRHNRVSASVFLGILETMQEMQKRAKEFEFPMLIQISSQDPIVSYPAVVEFYNHVTSREKTLYVYDNSRHEIYNDIERERAFADLRTYLNAQEDRS